MERFGVSIIQDDCTSCGLCPETLPSVFYLGEDNMAYVRDEGTAEPSKPKYQDILGIVALSGGSVQLAVDAAEECPGSCIYVHDLNEVADYSGN